MSKIYSHRLATKDDIPVIRELMDLAIYELQKDHLDENQLKAAHQFMGIDTGLIEDQTYFLILHGEGTADETVVGCGGWGKRETLYGGTHTVGRSDALLDPNKDRARVRAMYCHPGWARQGVGSYIMNIVEEAARNAGFTKMTLGATLVGEKLYEYFGYKAVERTVDVTEDGIEVPLIKMIKDF